MNLRELIELRRQDLNDSYSDLSDRAQRAGYDLSRSAIHKIATLPVENIPRTETVHALAAALKVCPARIVLAATESIPSIDDLDAQAELDSWTDDELFDELRRRITELRAHQAPSDELAARRRAPEPADEAPVARAAYTEPYADPPNGRQ